MKMSLFQINFRLQRFLPIFILDFPCPDFPVDVSFTCGFPDPVNMIQRCFSNQLKN